MASFLPRGRQLPPRCRGLQEDAVEAEFPKEQGNVVEDQVLELKSKDGAPSGKCFECVEPEGVLVDHRLVRTNVTKAQARNVQNVIFVLLCSERPMGPTPLMEKW